MKGKLRIPLLIVFGMTTLSLIGCISSKKAPREHLAKAAHLKPFDAIIVPGIPFKNGSWDSIMKARVIWSYILYKDGYTRNVIYSGGPVYSPYYEARVMGLYARQLGIPAEHIFYETRARHSTENIYYSYLLAMKQGFKSIALATDPVQSALLRSFTRRRFGTPIFHLPFVTDTLEAYNHLEPTIDPSSARSDTFLSITDREGFWTRMRGTLGKDIDWSQYKDGRVAPL